MGEWTSTMGTWGKMGAQAGIATGANFLSGMGQRILSGKSITFESSWDVMKASAIKGSATGIGSSFGNGTTAVIGRSALSSAANIAAFKLVEKDRLIKDYMEDGMTREQAQAAADTQDPNKRKIKFKEDLAEKAFFRQPFLKEKKG